MGGQDEIAPAIASAQHGNVTRPQLLAAGVSARAIERRLDKGWLIAVYRGVYRVGHQAPSMHADYMAAVLACGERARLSGEAAAHLMRLLRGRAPRPEVSAPLSRVVPGITTHHFRNLDDRDCWVYERIPATNPARTIVDIAASVSPDQLALAVHEAGIRFGTTPDDIEEALSRRPNAKHAARIRAVLHGDIKVTASRLERAFLRVLRKAWLPLPETNIRAGGRFVDCRWSERKLTVELDGYRYHASRHAWERDRKREREAYARGDQFRRYTWDDITRHPGPLLRELRPLLVGVIPS